MAYFDDLNNVSPASQAVPIFDLKEAMKAAGYTIRGSGDGLAAYSAVGDVITSSGSGAGGMNNTNAWFTVRQAAGGAAPYAGTREWTFQRGAFSYSWFVQYSNPNTTFDQSTSSATVRPTLLLTANLMNVTGSGSASAIFASTLNFTYQIRVGNAAENFHWYCISYPNGGGNINSRIANIPMASDSITSAEVEPFLLCATQSSLLVNIIGDSPQSEVYGWMGLNSLTGNLSPIENQALVYIDPNVGTIIPNNLGSNPENGNDDGVPIPWGLSNNSVTLVGTCFKGFSQKVKWSGINRVTGDTLDTLNYIVFDDTVWEWDGITVPSV